jgi:hypothetical protein
VASPGATTIKIGAVERTDFGAGQGWLKAPLLGNVVQPLGLGSLAEVSKVKEIRR